ncbi:unnamed protein product [Mytilus coruscus]|uniref:Uncharacterized protein n=1 Tax=Mytilus coruscus TaxID=42192 RepID=A0A6J8DK85_MYTCO|nr:unnamed protein product [Mytilus coruscus]
MKMEMTTVKASLQMDDVASSTSEAVHDNAEPHIAALELATRIHDFPLLTEPSYNLPPKMIRRGRPKGTETTVVGLPRRTKRVLPFLEKRPKEKEEAMLSWILKCERLNILQKNEDVTEKQISDKDSSCLKSAAERTRGSRRKLTCKKNKRDKDSK